MVHNEMHRTHRIGWLRAAVLGANDGIVSTASLLIGVAAADSGHSAVMLAGVAGLFAGALSMAAGEYVSVHSQADTEKADIELERKHLADEPEFELRELAGIYEGRGLDPELALQVAEQLMDHDALGAHTRDELGITDTLSANPLQAAVFSAVSFAIGATLPLVVAYFAPGPLMIWLIAASSLLFLALLGGIAARAGGAGIVTGAVRVLFWGAIAMGATALVGKLFGAVV
ncbi:MAG TPA: VIT family protein [Pyrinomonadaceae bacterium]|nr:VIT family protein [Chloracidobacterium sp.]HQX56020.1 VIT family protein [Pyrinomonadaceae bacterium]HQY67780.1 VIT family protein [Pyrinomonadaceae bacterium]